MADGQRLLSIVLPSFRDERILEAIASIRAFDDIDAVKIVVIDGGSESVLIKKIARVLRPDDILVSERDEGIFDGLNKGLERVGTPYMGWIGSDDMFSGEILASEVIRTLYGADIFISSIAFFREERIRRITHAWPSAHGMMRVGLHNPHYSTFGRSDLLKSERFGTADPVADIEYFLKIFAKEPKVAWTSRIGVLQGEGGFSNSSYTKVLKLNSFVFKAYRRQGNAFTAAIAVSTKLFYKAWMRSYFKFAVRHWPERFPIAHRAMQLSRHPSRQMEKI